MMTKQFLFIFSLSLNVFTFSLLAEEVMIDARSGSFSTTDQQKEIHIPVVNMQDYYASGDVKEKFLADLFDAMHRVGFFAVINTGVNAQVIKDAYAQAEEFFKRPAEYKDKSSAKETNGQRGFVRSEAAKGNKQKDKKEFYHIGSESNSLANVWPEQPGFESDLSHLYKELNRYVVPLQEAIMSALNLKAIHPVQTDFLNIGTEKGESLLRALYYPALPAEQLNDLSQEPLYWAAAHTDIDYLSILPYATEKGLQVFMDGKWHTIVVPEDAFIVNVGDMIENLTNGLFKSALHRVKALEPGKDRFSMVFFVHPTGETSLAPIEAAIEQTGGKALRAPGTRNHFLWERLIELGLASPALLELYATSGHVEKQMDFGRESPQVVQLLLDSGLASEELKQKLQERK